MIFDTLRTWAEVDLDAIEHNFNAARSHLPEHMKLLVEQPQHLELQLPEVVVQSIKPVEPAVPVVHLR